MTSRRKSSILPLLRVNNCGSGFPHKARSRVCDHANKSSSDSVEVVSRANRIGWVIKMFSPDITALVPAHCEKERLESLDIFIFHPVILQTAMDIGCPWRK